MSCSPMLATTPVSRRGALRRRPRAPPAEPASSSSGSESSPAGPATSTPGGRNGTSGRVRPLRLEIDDEDDLDLPSTQLDASREDGEVFWNMEASPRAREELRRRVAEADAKSPSARGARKRTNLASLKASPVAKFRAKKQEEGVPPATQDVLEEMKKDFAKLEEARNAELERGRLEKAQPLEEKMPTAKKAVIKLPNGPPRKKEEPDPFADSGDDSFLVRCSQAVEPKPPAAAQVGSKPQTRNAKTQQRNPFDDDPDDSFDFMLSQMDTKGLGSKKPAAGKQAFSFTKVSPAPVTAQNLDSSLRRFNSAGSQEPAASPVATPTSRASRGGFARNHSTPDVPGSKVGKPLLPGGRAMRPKVSAAVRCSQEEIERKRKEALARRNRKRR